MFINKKDLGYTKSFLLAILLQILCYNESGDNMKIITFEEKYRDDMIYMVLDAKNAIGRIPRLNEDLFW